MIGELRRDLRDAVRAFAKNPGFTAAATFTLALGIGATVAMFSIVYAVVLKPLPYREPDRLVLIQAETAVTGTRRPLQIGVFMSEFDGWKHAQTFEQPALFTRNSSALATHEGTEQISGALVSTEFFETLGGQFVAGRPLAVEDDAEPSCVVSERLARRLFGAPERALGQNLSLSDHAFTIVGVAAPEFKFPERDTDTWQSARFVRAYDSRDFGFQMIARARANTSIERIDAEVESIARSQPRNTTAQLHGNVVRLADQIAGPSTRILVVLFAAVALVLVVACINLANLTLARNASRAREIAIRASLGASRRRLIVSSLIESACLALLGTAAGIALAYGLVRLAVSLATFMPNLEFARIDAWTLGFAALAMLFAALLSGAAPALVSAWSANEPRLTVVASSRPHQRIRRVLCVAEWSVALVLLVSASLLARSLVRLMTSDLGVSTDHVVTASLNYALGQRPTEDDVQRRVHDLLDHVKLIPGVQTAAVGTSLPPQVSRLRMTLRREGDSVDYAASGVPVTPGYFSALRIQLLQGRVFDETDDERHPPVMIMSADAARHFFGEGEVIGKTLKVPQASWLERKSPLDMALVGVIANVKYSGLSAPPDDAIYRPFRQQPWSAPFLVVRTAGDPNSLMSVIRREIAAVDPALVVSSVATLDSIMADASAPARAQTIVLTSLTTLAVAMAAVGLYGVVAFAVEQQTKEIGIRMALGAGRGRVLQMTVKDGATIGLLGLLIGVALAFAVARLLRASLYGVSPTDPLSFLGAAALLLVVAMGASYLPARRATAVDPLVALRHD